VTTENYKYKEDENVDRPFISKFDIQIRGCYLYNGLPFLKVTFIDVEKAVRLMEAGVISETMIHDKRTELIPHDQLQGYAPNVSTATGYVTKEVVAVCLAALC